MTLEVEVKDKLRQLQSLMCLLLCPSAAAWVTVFLKNIV